MLGYVGFFGKTATYLVLADIVIINDYFEGN